jgi:hypothetical protein
MRFWRLSIWLRAAMVALMLCSGVAVADHNVTVEMYYNGAWQTVPAYTRDGISLSRGAPGEGQDSPPSGVGLTLDNRDGSKNPRNPNSPLYGLAGRNTPLRVSADSSVRATVEASSWAPQRAIKGDAWTELQGGGILRRLQQGKTPLKSSLERAIRASNPLAFWPLTDGKDATALQSGIGGDPLVLSGVRPGVVDGPAGQSTVFPDVASSGTPVSARGPLPTGIPAAGWGIEFMTYIGHAAVAGETPDLVALQWSVPGSDPWQVFIGEDSSTGPYIIVAGKISGVDASVYNTSTPDFGWNHVLVTFFQFGGVVLVRLNVNGINLGTTDAQNVAGTIVPPSGDLIVGQTEAPVIPEYMESASVGMVAMYGTAGVTNHSDAAFGYAGERAGVRFVRVLNEEGITATVVGDEDDTQPMGPQPVDTLVSIVRECVHTDAGLMHEPRDSIGLAMRTGRDLYNQSSVLSLNFASGGVAVPLAPVLDDQNIRNDVKAVRRNGSAAQAVKSSGPLNVSDPVDDPEGVGRYDVQVDVNPSIDERLLAHANWHLHKGTVDEPRYPQVVVDLDAVPVLTSAVNALDIGDKISITNLPADWYQGTATLIVLGVKESFPAGAGDYRRKVTLNTVPASAYEVGIVGANDGSTDLRGAAVDTDNSTLSSGINSSVTSFSVTSVNGTVWTTDSNDWDPARNGGGLYIVVGGEEMRVTNISGASSPQTFTVVRSTNGVVKTAGHAAGAPVHVRYPVRVGL